MAIQFVHISWHKIAYRRVNGTVTTYPSQKKKDIWNLSTIERGHISVKRNTKQNISQITILLNWKRALSFQTI